MYKTVIKIDGMMCGMCESHICDHIRNNLDVKKVSASHSKGQAIILSEKEIPIESLKEIIEKTGYTVVDVYSEIYQKKKMFGLFKVN